MARELKYFSPNTVYNALERELGTVVPAGSEEPDYEDKWADLYDDESDEDDEAAKGADSDVADASGSSANEK